MFNIKIDKMLKVDFVEYTNEKEKWIENLNEKIYTKIEQADFGERFIEYIKIRKPLFININKAFIDNIIDGMDPLFNTIKSKIKEKKTDFELDYIDIDEKKRRLEQRLKKIKDFLFFWDIEYIDYIEPIKYIQNGEDTIQMPEYIVKKKYSEEELNYIIGTFIYINIDTLRKIKNIESNEIHVNWIYKKYNRMINKSFIINVFNVLYKNDEYKKYIFKIKKKYIFCRGGALKDVEYIKLKNDSKGISNYRLKKYRQKQKTMNKNCKNENYEKIKNVILTFYLEYNKLPTLKYIINKSELSKHTCSKYRDLFILKHPNCI